MPVCPEVTVSETAKQISLDGVSLTYAKYCSFFFRLVADVKGVQVFSVVGRMIRNPCVCVCVCVCVWEYKLLMTAVM